MEEKKPSADHLQDIQDIRRIMEQSSRFISLSGLSGVAAGTCALVGAWIAYRILYNGNGGNYRIGRTRIDSFDALTLQLLGLAAVVFVVAFVSSFYLTWVKAKKQGVSLWGYASRRLALNMLIPLVTGGCFIIGMLVYDVWLFVSPASLVFYGLALINASKYTLNDIRFLGYAEVVLGLINIFFPGYGLWFWAVGFGVLHIIYGIVMWNKYDRKA